MTKLKQGRKLLRISTLSLLIMFFIISLEPYNNSSDMIDYSNRYTGFMAAYRIPMVLGNNYFKLLLNIGNKTVITKQINTLTAQLRSVVASNLATKTIFDSAINAPSHFPPFSVKTYNQNNSYDQTELLYFILSCATDLNTPNISYNSHAMQQFDSYLTPSFDKMMNGTKNSFHNTFTENLKYL